MGVIYAGCSAATVIAVCPLAVTVICCRVMYFSSSIPSASGCPNFDLAVLDAAGEHQTFRHSPLNQMAAA